MQQHLTDVLTHPFTPIAVQTSMDLMTYDPPEPPGYTWFSQKAAPPTPGVVNDVCANKGLAAIRGASVC